MFVFYLLNRGLDMDLIFGVVIWTSICVFLVNLWGCHVRLTLNLGINNGSRLLFIGTAIVYSIYIMGEMHCACITYRHLQNLSIVWNNLINSPNKNVKWTVRFCFPICLWLLLTCTLSIFVTWFTFPTFTFVINTYFAIWTSFVVLAFWRKKIKYIL